MRLDVAEMMRVEPSPDAGNDRAEREGGNLERTHVEAHQVGDALVIMDRGDRDTKAGRKQQPNQHGDTERKHRDRWQTYERGDRITRRSADHIEVEDRSPVRSRPMQRWRARDRCRVSAAPAPPRPIPTRPAATPPKRYGDQRRQRKRGAEIGRGVTANRSEAGHTEIELAGRDRQERGVGVDNIDRQQHQHAFKIAAHARAPALAPPNRPVGRTIRMNSSKP